MSHTLHARAEFWRLDNQLGLGQARGVETTQPLTEPPVNRPVQPTSLLARMFNVFATPGEVFDEVQGFRELAGSPSHFRT